MWYTAAVQVQNSTVRTRSSGQYAAAWKQSGANRPYPQQQSKYQVSGTSQQPMYGTTGGTQGAVMTASRV